MAARGRPSAGRILELDGLRAFAILTVMSLHLSPKTGTFSGLRRIFTGGWIGVDLFFVLSGYLITGILLDSRGRDGYYSRFFRNRALRILPLYYLCTGIFYLALMAPSARDQMTAFRAWGGVSWFLIYLANIRMAMVGSFPPAALFSAFWSLQIEEQFYLLFPLVVASCSVVVLKRVMVGCVLGALALRCAMTALLPGSWLAAYVLMPCRMDSLAAGAILAIWQRQPAGLNITYLKHTLYVAGPLTILTLWVSSGDFSHPLVSSVGYTLLALFFGSILGLTTAAPKAAIVGLLRFRPLVYIGRIAYGLYMLHWPANLVTRAVLSKFGVAPFGSITAMASLSVAFAVASFSWELVESKILAMRTVFEKPALIQN